MSLSNSQFKGLLNMGTPAGESFGKFRNSMGNAMKIMGAGSLMQGKAMTSLPGMNALPNLPKMPSLKGLPTNLGK
jgi:hypothetical protein